ncbi:hypothetical protein ISG33_04295 [Glaciecola sp. MH2013]|uniref:DUF3592 domain-containing protein n=1 Tax=Glaciecola sp. MH2013 TaxID=2785524 RepID=UPI00189FA867|nr:DUF3592 domain-containing protein [Glaciecola sp. MH2013]MBF7072618.1 hypothetical protein [Glaciecola sp. MH2013]
MKKRNKFKEASISMLIGLFLLLVFLVAGRHALPAYLFGTSTQATVVDYTVTKSQEVMIDNTQRPPKLHEILVEYRVDGSTYWLTVNSHVYSAFGIINMGDTLTVAYDDEHPQSGYVMNYALFTTLSSVLLPFLLLIFIAVTPQWLYHYRQK